MLKVAIVRSTSLLYDPSLPKTIRSLSKRYSTSLLGWNRDGSVKMRKGLLREKLSTQFDKSTIHMLNMGGPAGTPLLILYYPIFWSWIFLQLCIHRPNIVHACNLDTVIPCYLYKIVSGRKLIFEVKDRFAMAYIPENRKLLYRLVNSLEERFASKADVFITVAEALISTFRKIPKNYKIIMNCCEDMAVPFKSSHDGIFTAAFTGHISKTRGLETVLSVVRDMKDVELIAAGKVTDPDLLDLIDQTKNARYLGFLTPTEAISLEARSDVIFALYALQAAQDKFALPLKLWEAMMCGVPIITNVAREIVAETDCGIIVNYNDTSQIRSALAVLRDNCKLRHTLGNNGRKAFIENYNWGKMEERLYSIYDELLRK